jgi:hypothetical protein
MSAQVFERLAVFTDEAAKAMMMSKADVEKLITWKVIKSECVGTVSRDDAIRYASRSKGLLGQVLVERLEELRVLRGKN